MKKKPPIRPDRAAQPAKAGEARAVEGYRLVLPRYSFGGRTVLRRSDQRYVSHVVADCSTEHAARELARKLNRLDRYERDRAEDRDAARLALVERELRKARRKHPKFVDRFAVFKPKWYDTNLEVCRRKNAMYEPTGQIEVTDVLKEEVWEAMSAYAHGDLAGAIYELAQCAAVCVRAMEYVQNEMEKTKC